MKEQEMVSFPLVGRHWIILRFLSLSSFKYALVFLIFLLLLSCFSTVCLQDDSQLSSETPALVSEQVENDNEILNENYFQISKNVTLWSFLFVSVDANQEGHHLL